MNLQIWNSGGIKLHISSLGKLWKTYNFRKFLNSEIIRQSSVKYVHCLWSLFADSAHFLEQCSPRMRIGSWSRQMLLPTIYFCPTLVSPRCLPKFQSFSFEHISRRFSRLLSPLLSMALPLCGSLLRSLYLSTLLYV